MTDHGWSPAQGWLAQLADELRRYGLGPALITAVVTEADAHLRDSGEPPTSTFGSPHDYAAAVVESLTDTNRQTPAGPGQHGDKRGSAFGTADSAFGGAGGASSVAGPGGWPTVELAAVSDFGRAGSQQTAQSGQSSLPAQSTQSTHSGQSGQSAQRQSAPVDAPVLLRARGITKRYGRRTVLDGVDLTVRAGQVAAVVGANGCGKSTFLRICAGLASPDAGTVQVRGALGFCPQDGGTNDFLLPDEHFTLVGAGRGLDRARSAAAGRAAANGLDWDPSGAPAARRLSGGTRQKLNLVLAGLGDPDVLLLDEPYQGFDQGSYLDFWQQVWQWRDAGKAVVVVTHLLSHLDRVDIVLDLSADKKVTA